MTIKEAEGCVEVIYGKVNPDARIIWGTSVNPELSRTIGCMLVITGVKSKQILGPPAKDPKAQHKDGIDFVL